jgi:hypothetical protein
LIEEIPNRGANLNEAIVTTAVEVNNDGFAIDDLVSNSGGIYPEVCVVHSV